MPLVRRVKPEARLKDRGEQIGIVAPYLFSPPFTLLNQILLVKMGVMSNLQPEVCTAPSLAY